MKNLVFFSIIALLVSSCMTTFNGVLTPTNDLKNVKYINTAFGSAQATYYLGLAGTKHDALVLEAKMNMMKNFPLDSTQYYANYTVDFRKKNLLLVQSALVTVSADIVQEKLTPNEENYSDAFKSKLGISNASNLSLKIGDTVVDRKLNYYVVEANNGASIVVKPVGSSELRFSKLVKKRRELFLDPSQIKTDAPKKGFVFDN